MSTKRKPVELDPNAFAAAAIPQANPVDQLVAAGSPKPSPKIQPRVPPKALKVKAGAEEAKGSRQASRIGKVQVQTWVAEDQRVELHVVAARQRRSVEDLLREAIEGLIKKYSAK